MNRKIINSMGLFIIMLVLTMPFYSANALAASLQITKNSGDDHIENYLDAQGDTWTVEATIGGLSQGETVSPDNVKLKIGSNEVPFTSCSGSTFGSTCQYISLLTNGVAERDYSFQVIYNFFNAIGAPDSVSSGAVLHADGSGPAISIASLQQNSQGQVIMDFTVKDKVHANAPAVGIKQIEIVDADTNAVLQTITLPQGQTNQGGQPGVQEYNSVRDGEFAGVLQASLSGEGTRHFRIRAQDWLGHNALQQPVATAYVDMIAPSITDSLNLTTLGRFMGQYVVSSDITLDVQETSEPLITAFSQEASLEGQQADCVEDAVTAGLWHCQWSNLQITPAETISVQVVAVDEYGNTAQRTLSRSFVTDIQAPQVQYFGARKVFEGNHFIRSGHQRIVLTLTEDGAGIRREGITANLQALGKGNNEMPDECDEEGSTITCFWETSKTFTADGVINVGLTKLQDNVGNQGTLPQAELLIDTAGPIVETIELYGVSEVGSKDYVQSNDRLKIQLQVRETSGLQIFVNLNDAVLDAQTIFPETKETINARVVPTSGWQMFTDENCDRTEGGAWACELETEPVRSGPDRVEIELKVRDTASNEAETWPDDAKNAALRDSAESGFLTFDVLGLSQEENPNYWELDLRGTRPLLPFVDLDTTPLIAARIPMRVALHSLGNAQAIDINVQDCVAQEPIVPGQPATTAAGAGRVTGLATTGLVTGLATAQITGLTTHELQSAQESAGNSPSGQNAPAPGTPEAAAAETAALQEIPLGALPEVSRTILYGGVSSEGIANPTPTLLLEFAPFDARESFKAILEQSGKQTVDVPVICTLKIFSKVGDVAIRSPEIQEVTFMVPFAFSELGALDENLDEKVQGIRDSTFFKIAEITKYLNSIIKWVRYISGLISIINNGLIVWNIAKGSLDGLKVAVIGSPIAVGACAGMTGAQQSVIEGISYVQIPLAILSCDPRAQESGGEKVLLGKYGALQKEVLRVYNIYTGRALIGLPATSLYENVIASTVGLCVPGLIYNLEKYRQVKCREIICYEQEIAAGVATPDSCAKLDKYLMCRYVLGNVVNFPFIGAWDVIIQFIKDWISSPLGWVRAALQVPCIYACAASTTGSAWCTYGTAIVKFLDIIDSLASLVYTRPTITSDPYCSQL